MKSTTQHVGDVDDFQDQGISMEFFECEDDHQTRNNKQCVQTGIGGLQQEPKLKNYQPK